MNKPISAALISVAGTTLSDGERRLIEQYRPLGVSLFARNIENRSQLAELTRQIREAAEDENIIIAVDQEGGRVRRLAEPEFRPYASLKMSNDAFIFRNEVSDFAAVAFDSRQATVVRLKQLFNERGCP